MSPGKAIRKKQRNKARSRSARSGIHFPVGRIHKILRTGQYAPRIGGDAPIFLAAILEYLVSEVLELASDVAKAHERIRIIPRHILLAIRKDEELNHLFGKNTISQSGVVPMIQPALLPIKTVKRAEETT